MAEAPRRTDFLLKTSEDVLREIASKRLTPEDVASAMLVNKEAHRIFGDERVWKAMAENLHIQPQGPVGPNHSWRKDVVAFYGRANKIALQTLDPNHNGRSLKNKPSGTSWVLNAPIEREIDLIRF